jgi:hypothetical protein
MVLVAETFTPFYVQDLPDVSARMGPNEFVTPGFVDDSSLVDQASHNETPSMITKAAHERNPIRAVRLCAYPVTPGSKYSCANASSVKK